MVTLDVSQIGRLSCNPAIGGLAKGHLVREIDALGGLMGVVADATTIQFRKLNTRRGLAVQSSRAQVDIDRYPREMQRRLCELERLTIIEDEVVDLLIQSGQVEGVRTSKTTLFSPKVIITTGTFLAAVMHCGSEQTNGGRIGDEAARELALRLRALGLRVGRLKTGTVPRLDSTTIDWDQTEIQQDTAPDGQFSFRPRSTPTLPQVDCHITYTTAQVHEIIKRDLHLSPMFTGAIRGRGPRYCPSIEDKIARFPDRDRHLLFLEPEGLDTNRVYVNGVSTSLPVATQDEFLKEIPGLRYAKVLQYGYAVEYDFCDPTQLGRDLQHQEIPGLYFAGQVNGTSGYEEAAAQGLVAGVSAARDEPIHIDRSQAYIAVLIDDLVTRGIGGEPYRMFTSRAEHRLMLREGNADRRLMAIGRELGLVMDSSWDRLARKMDAMDRYRQQFENTVLKPCETTNQHLRSREVGEIHRPTTALDLLRRPEVTWSAVWSLVFDQPCKEESAIAEMEIDVKYEGYIRRAERRARTSDQLDRVKIPIDVNWMNLHSISTEVRERLMQGRPTTLGQAARLPGVTPAAINIIASWLVRSDSVQE